MRPEAQAPELVFKMVIKEPLIAILPSDHRLAAREAIDPRDIAGETFISVSKTAPVLRVVIDDPGPADGTQPPPCPGSRSRLLNTPPWPSSGHAR